MMTNVMTNPTSRQKILAYLSQHPAASAEEISLSLRVTAANIRHHLSILVADGRVRLIGMRPEQGRGRPVRVYSPGETILGDNLETLAGALLDILAEANPVGLPEAILQSLATRLVPTPSGVKGAHITRRLAAAIEQLALCGYQARWEAHAAAPRVIIEGCPYAAIVQKHPELCRVDAIILEQLLQGGSRQTARMEKNSRGLSFCQFELRIT